MQEQSKTPSIFPFSAPAAGRGKTICLNMIVRDEAHVITRCLESVKPWIDYWVIVDTGSVDRTKELVREYLAEVPGELHERPWRNFGHNRQEALDLARGKADYTLTIDADEILAAAEGFGRPALRADAYSLQLRSGGTSFWRPALVANRLPWRWEGVLHEYLDCAQPHAIEQLPGLAIVSFGDGGRSQVGAVRKYARDARVLEEALEAEPGNARYQFYLAQSYRDSEQWQRALEAYQKRVAMGGWEEEVWFSLYQIGQLGERLGWEADKVAGAYLAAWSFRPRRAEPLAQLARLHREAGKHALAHLYAERAAAMAKPDDILFLDESVYAWRALDEYAVAAYWADEAEQSAAACRRLLEGGALPADQRGRVMENLAFALRRLGEDGAGPARAAA